MAEEYTEIEQKIYNMETKIEEANKGYPGSIEDENRIDGLHKQLLKLEDQRQKELKYIRESKAHEEEREREGPTLSR